MLIDSFPSVPDHIVDLLTHSAEIKVDLTGDHAPHRLITFLYTDSAYHDPVMQLNSKSALSLRSGDTLHLFDRRLMGKFSG